MTTITRYHHLSLSVTDLGRSSSWYQEVLGFEVTAEIDGAGFRRIRLVAPGSGVTLTLTAHDGELGGAFDEHRPGLDHVAFEVADSDAFDALKERFVRMGVVHSDVKTSDGRNALITFRDPDNIQLEVFVVRVAVPSS